MKTFGQPRWPLSYGASLDPCAARHTIVAPQLTIHHYEEQIAGRTYQIEVSLVAAERWRAQIARLPGMPTSMMPFYGTTPEAAAHELSKWLSLVSGVVVGKT